MGLLTSDKGGVLCGDAIRNAIAAGQIKIDPPDSCSIIDDGLLCMVAPEIAYFHEIDYIDLHLDPSLTVNKKLTQLKIPEEGLMLRPGIQYLIPTITFIASNKYLITAEIQGLAQTFGMTGQTSYVSTTPSNVVVPVQVMYPTKIYPDTMLFMVRFYPFVTR